MSLTIPVQEIVNESTDRLLAIHPSWERVPLATIAKILNGFAFKSALFSGIKGVPLLRIRDVGRDRTECFYDGDYQPHYIVHAGDLIIGMDGDFNCARWTGPDALLNQRVCKIELLTRNYEPSFLNFALPGYLRAINERTSSQTVRHLSSQSIAEIPLPLPPLAEQKRIVAKVEELLGRVKAAKEHLSRVSMILKRFRQAVLAAACSGRLTKDWRKNNPVSEAVEALLEDIQKRRLGKATTASQEQKIIYIYSYQEEGDSNSLPETWRYLALDKLCESFQYGTSKKSESFGKVAVLRMGNIQNGEIDWSDLAYTSDEEEIEKYKLNPGDVLFNRTNSPELVGKTAIYRGDHPAIFAGYLIRIHNFKELDSGYLNLCLNTIYARGFCLKAKTDGVSQSNINAQKLGKFEVPYCPLEEQYEIVRRVESMCKLADAVEKRVEAAKGRAEKLTQAILAKAFRGELVPTEAELALRVGRSYESASELLAKIKSNR